MTLIFKKAVLIASAQVEPERPPPGLAFLCGVCESVSLAHVPLDLSLHILERVDVATANRLASITAVYPVTDQEALKLMHDLAKSFCHEVISHGPDLIMISVLTYWQNAWTQVLIENLRNYLPGTTILIGGAGPASVYQNNKTFARLWADQGLIDYYVLGEGDLAIPLFLQGEIGPGVNSASSTVETRVPQIDDLDAIPLPSYKNITISKYLQQSYAGDISITGSRGCVRRCSFCDVGHYWKKFRYRSGKSLAKEIEKHYLDTGITKFFFTDSLINGSLKAFSDFLDELLVLKKQYPGLDTLSYYGQFIIRAKNFHREDLYARMAQSGLRHLQVGIESGSEKVREHIGKKFTNQDIDYHLEMCSKYHISNSLLLFLGYPTETREDFESTMDLVRRYQKYMINDTVIDVSDALPLFLLRGTPLWNRAHELGIDTGTGGVNYAWTSSSNPELSVRERYRRYIEFQRLLIDLKYTRVNAIQTQIDEIIIQIDDLKHARYAEKSSIMIVPLEMKSQVQHVVQ